jgi:hypothetical protein
MGLLRLFYPWSLILQIAAAVHYYRTRPAQYWIYIIYLGGPFGALAYLVTQAGPDIMAFAGAASGVPRKKRLNMLEGAIADNPSSGNFEELGDLYFDVRNYQAARDAYDKAIAAKSDTPDCFYRRATCALQLGDAAAAVPDLQFVLNKDPDHDFHRAAGLLAHAYARSGQSEKAEAQFLRAITASTLSETYLNYADFLASQGRTTEARQWAQKVLDKERTMPDHLRRRERPWFLSAREMLKRLAVQSPAAPAR